MPYLRRESSENCAPQKMDIRWDIAFNIGRSRDNDLKILNKKVSKHQARIRFSHGRFWIEDLDSAWGTSVNGSKIRTKILNDGDEVSFGPEVRFQFLTRPGDPSISGNLGSDQQRETILDIDMNVADYTSGASGAKSGMSPKYAKSCLIQVDDTGQEIDRYTIEKDEFTIGRGQECDLVLNHAHASKNHCRISFSDGIYYIEDLKSTNGVFVNDKKVNYQQLCHGDHVRIAYLEFRFGYLSGDHSPPMDGKGIAMRVPLASESSESGTGIFRKSASYPWGSLIFAAFMLLAAAAIIIYTLLTR